MGKFYIGIPCTRLIKAGPISAILRWAQESKHEVCVDLDDQSASIAWARSTLVGRARDFAADWLIMVDSDIIPETPLNEIASYLAQAKSRGYGAVISPTLSIHGAVLTTPLGEKWKSVDDIPTTLFEIDGGAGGLMAISLDAMNKLKVLDWVDTPEGVSYPLYCAMSPNESEDYSLCRNVRASSGLRVGADPRIHVNHLKEYGVPSWRVSLKESLVKTPDGRYKAALESAPADLPFVR